MNAKRLLKLCDLLEHVSPNKFDMTSCYDEEIGKGGKACIEAACAFGWATTIPEFRRAGLKRSIYGGCVEYNFYEVSFRGKVDYQAAALFFDLYLDDAWELFSFVPYQTDPSRYVRVTPKTVARKIRSFVEAQQKLSLHQQSAYKPRKSYVRLVYNRRGRGRWGLPVEPVSTGTTCSETC